ACGGRPPPPPPPPPARGLRTCGRASIIGRVFGGHRLMIRIAGLVAIATVLGSTVSAERLGGRRDPPRDGLTGDFIIPLFRDSRGFLWFSTRDGLSRFDGVRFTSYGMADGLPH